MLFIQQNETLLHRAVNRIHQPKNINNTIPLVKRLLTLGLDIHARTNVIQLILA